MADLRIERTEKMLCGALLELMCEKDFSAITVGELCDRAMVRRATFYKHYADKYDFLAFFVHRIRAELVTELDGADPIDYCVGMFRGGIRFFESHMRLLRRAVDSPAYSVMTGILCSDAQNDLTERVREAWNVPEADAEIFARFYVGGCFNLLRCWLTEPSNDDAEMVTQQLRELLTRSRGAFLSSR